MWWDIRLLWSRLGTDASMGLERVQIENGEIFLKQTASVRNQVVLLWLRKCWEISRLKVVDLIRTQKHNGRNKGRGILQVKQHFSMDVLGGMEKLMMFWDEVKVNALYEFRDLIWCGRKRWVGGACEPVFNVAYTCTSSGIRCRDVWRKRKMLWTLSTAIQGCQSKDATYSYWLHFSNIYLFVRYWILE